MVKVDLPNKILVILGHPDKGSFCGALANAYVKGAIESGAEIRRINITDLNFDINLQKGYKTNQYLELDLVNAQNLIKWAKHIVWIFPIWWNLFPAKMKGFIDRVFIPGFAYKYTKGKFLWERYLKDKSCRMIVTMDNFVIIYFLMNAPATSALRSLMKFVGIGKVRSIHHGRIRKRSQPNLEKLIKKAEKLGRKQK